VFRGGSLFYVVSSAEANTSVPFECHGLVCSRDLFGDLIIVLNRSGDRRYTGTAERMEKDDEKDGFVQHWVE